MPRISLRVLLLVTASLVVLPRIPAESQGRTGHGFFQIGAFREPSLAEALSQKLRLEGFPVHVLSTEDFARVLAGPYCDVDEIESAESALTTGGYPFLFRSDSLVRSIPAERCAGRADVASIPSTDRDPAPIPSSSAATHAIEVTEPTDLAEVIDATEAIDARVGLEGVDESEQDLSSVEEPEQALTSVDEPEQDLSNVEESKQTLTSVNDPERDSFSVEEPEGTLSSVDELLQDLAIATVYPPVGVGTTTSSVLAPVLIPPADSPPPAAFSAAIVVAAPRLTPPTGALSGKIRDTAGRAMAGVTVRLFHGNATEPVLETVTDAAGYFAFGNPMGEHRMGVSVPGFGAFEETYRVVPGMAPLVVTLVPRTYPSKSGSGGKLD